MKSYSMFIKELQKERSYGKNNYKQFWTNKRNKFLPR